MSRPAPVTTAVMPSKRRAASAVDDRLRQRARNITGITALRAAPSIGLAQQTENEVWATHALTATRMPIQTRRGNQTKLRCYPSP